jgi:hypothetical protein
MDKVNELISDERLNEVFGSANFGSTRKREIVRNTLLKCASGYYTSSTAKAIVIELGLVHPVKWELTKAGQKYLFDAYSNGLSV